MHLYIYLVNFLVEDTLNNIVSVLQGMSSPLKIASIAANNRADSGSITLYHLKVKDALSFEQGCDHSLLSRSRIKAPTFQLAVQIWQPLCFCHP